MYMIGIVVVVVDVVITVVVVPAAVLVIIVVVAVIVVVVFDCFCFHLTTFLFFSFQLLSLLSSAGAALSSNCQPLCLLFLLQNSTFYHAVQLAQMSGRLDICGPMEDTT